MNQKDFIEMIKRKRILKMMSQQEVATTIPVSKSAYSKIENHLQNPNYFVIRRLAEIFDIDLNVIKQETEMIHFYD